jgi:glycosyltransferase family protein
MNILASKKLRYGKLFKFPRKVAKELLSLAYPIVIKFYPLPKVLSIEETIDKLVTEKISICRFGDGEFLYIIDFLNLPFQKQNQVLRNKMIEILNSDNPKILVGLPIGYHSLNNLKKESKKTWQSQVAWIYPRLRKYLPSEKVFYNASMTRLYMEYEDSTKSGYYFEKIMKIWEGREIVLLEGEKSRLGVGNNLFEKAKSVERILAPAHDAFDKYEELLNEALKQPKYKLVLIAMGPTAKPLAYELALNGYQAVDIGNIDVEYEWYLRGATSKVKLVGKYTSEAIGGRIVENIIDSKYESQIIKKLTN